MQKQIKHISVSLPTGFHHTVVSDALPNMPEKNKVAVFQHTDKEAQIIITKTTVNTRNFELPYYKLFYERLFASQHAVLQKSVFTTIGKRKCIRIEFVNQAVGQPLSEEDEIEITEFKNIFLVMILRGRLVLVNFSFLNALKDEWDAKMEDSIRSIKIRKSFWPQFRLPKRKKRKINRNLLTFYNYLEENTPENFVDKASGVWHQPFYNAMASITDFQKEIRIKTIKAGNQVAQFESGASNIGFLFASDLNKANQQVVFQKNKIKRIYKATDKVSALSFYQKAFLKEKNAKLTFDEKTLLILGGEKILKLELIS